MSLKCLLELLEVSQFLSLSFNLHVFENTVAVFFNLFSILKTCSFLEAFFFFFLLQAFSWCLQIPSTLMSVLVLSHLPLTTPSWAQMHPHPSLVQLHSTFASFQFPAHSPPHSLLPLNILVLSFDGSTFLFALVLNFIYSTYWWFPVPHEQLKRLDNRAKT